MNGPTRTTGKRAQSDNFVDPTVLTGVETAENSVGAGAPGKALPNGDVSALSALTAGLGGLGISKSRGNDPSSLKREIEVEMQ